MFPAQAEFSRFYNYEGVAILGLVSTPGGSEIQGPLLHHQWRRRHSDSGASDDFRNQGRPGGSQREVLGGDPGANSVLQ
jgi:hypothetical protein